MLPLLPSCHLLLQDFLWKNQPWLQSGCRTGQLEDERFPSSCSGTESAASVLDKPFSRLGAPATDSGSCPRTGTAGSRCNRKFRRLVQSKSSPMSPFLWLAGACTCLQQEDSPHPKFKEHLKREISECKMTGIVPLPYLLLKSWGPPNQSLTRVSISKNLEKK